MQPVGRAEHRDALALPDPPDDAFTQRALGAGPDKVGGADLRDPGPPRPVRCERLPIRSYLPPGIPARLIQRALMVWTGLFGVISFELYGQLHQVVGEGPADRDTFFAECIRRWLQFMNLA